MTLIKHLNDYKTDMKKYTTVVIRKKQHKHINTTHTIRHGY